MWKKFTEMFNEAHEIVGWLGMLLILAAYAGVSLDVFSASSFQYQFMNAAGAGALIYTALKTKAYPIVALNIVWLTIALFVLYSFA